MLDRQGGDPVLQGLGAAALEAGEGEVADPLRGPQLRDVGPGGGVRQVERGLEEERLAVPGAADLEPDPARLRVAPEEHPRLAVHQGRGLAGGEVLDLEAVEADREVPDPRRDRPRELGDHLVVDPLAGVDPLDRAAGPAGEVARGARRSRSCRCRRRRPGSPSAGRGPGRGSPARSPPGRR